MKTPTARKFFSRKRLLCAAALAALYSILGFFVLPYVLKTQLIKHASAGLKRPISIESIYLNPWTFTCEIRDLHITDHDGKSFASWRNFSADFELSSIFRGAWHFQEIRFDGLHGRIQIDKNGTPNFADLLSGENTSKSPEATDAEAKLPSVSIAHFRVHEARFDYGDDSRAHPFSTTVGPLNFDLKNFATKPEHDADHAFVATTESGERITWSGTLCALPLGSRGRLELSNIALPKYAPFYASFLNAKITRGTLEVLVDYDAQLVGDAPRWTIRDSAVRLRDFALCLDGAEQDAVVLPFLELAGIEAKSESRTARAAKLLVRGANLTATRLANGTVDFSSIFRAPNPQTVSVEKPTAAATPWTAQLDALQIENASVKLRDLLTARPVELPISEIHFLAGPLSTRLADEISLDLKLRWADKGAASVAGKVQPQPLRAALRVDAYGIEVRPLDPYFAPKINALVASGAVRASGNFTATAASANSGVSLAFQGAAGLDDFSMLDATHAQPLANIGRLSFDGIDISFEPEKPISARLDTIALERFFLQLAIDAQGKLNLQTAAAGSENSVPEKVTSPSTTQPVSPEEKQSQPLIQVGAVSLSEGRVAFADASTQPGFSTELRDIAGTIKGLSSEQIARADVEISAALNGSAPLKISGQINPLSSEAYSDIKVAFTGIDLTPFTPYTGRFIGYAVGKGRLNLDLRYQLSARDLIAENRVVFDQFYLGQTVESPDAVNLPLKLALALLRNGDGKIDLDLPVRGNLDDPDFKYGRIVWKMVGNIILKAAASPFSLLGSLVGGASGDELSSISFYPGSSELDEVALGRLAKLGEALTRRPALGLEVDARPDVAADSVAIREAKILAEIKSRKVQELVKKTAQNVDAATLVLTTEETARGLAGLYAEAQMKAQSEGRVFGAESATQISRPPQPEKAERKGNVFTRTARYIFGSEDAKVAVAADGSAKVTLKDSSGNLVEITTAQMLRTLALELPPPTAELSDLATRRAAAVLEFLVREKQIDSSRLFVVAPAGDAPASADARPAARFNLQ